MFFMDYLGAITSIISSILAFVGTFLTIFLSVKKVSKDYYNRSITQERIKWLNKMRSDFGIVMAAWNLKQSGTNNYYNPQINKDFYDEKMFEAEKAKAEIISRLKTSKLEDNEFNLSIKVTLYKINFIKEMTMEEMNQMEDEIELMRINMNNMLEAEWEKSKEEAR